MRLLLDTQILIWIPLDDRRLSNAAVEALQSPDNSLHVSAVTAFEFADLQRRRRFPINDPIDFLTERIGFALVDFPEQAWRLVESLPDIHRDPVDRMLVAHAILGGFTLVTADTTICRYPVRTIG